MKYQDYIVDASRKAAAEAFRYAKAVPADKLEWSPLDAGRSVLDICRELAMTPTWASETVDGPPVEWTEEAFAAVKKEQSTWTTVEACEEQFNERMKTTEKVFREFPDERLSETKWLPYEGRIGREEPGVFRPCRSRLSESLSMDQMLFRVEPATVLHPGDQPNW